MKTNEKRNDIVRRAQVQLVVAYRVYKKDVHQKETKYARCGTKREIAYVFIGVEDVIFCLHLVVLIGTKIRYMRKMANPLARNLSVSMFYQRCYKDKIIKSVIKRKKKK